MLKLRCGETVQRFFDRPRAVFELTALGVLISAAIIIITAVGGAKLLAEEGSEGLPIVYVLLAVVSLPLASAISAALGRWPTAHICRIMCAASLALAVGLRAAMELPVPGIPQAICITAYALEIVFDTLFWLSVAEYLPTRELKRHTPFLAAAFGLGGVAGGLIATMLCQFVPAEDLLLLAAGLFGLCFVQYRRMMRQLKPLGDAGDDDEPDVGALEALRSTFRVFHAFPITGTIAVGIFLMSALFCLQDYLAMTIFQETYKDEDALASFIAMAYSAYQVVELLMVVAIGGLVLERAAPILRNLIFPLTTIGCLSVLAFSWQLQFGVLLHLNANAVSNAVFEPVKTINYAAIPFRALAPVRMMVEGIVYPIGIAASGLSLLWLQSFLEPSSILYISLGVAVAFAVTSCLIGNSFLPSLITSLRVRAIRPADYLRGGPERWFSRADIRQLLAHPTPEARHFGRSLARVLAPDLLQDRELRAGQAGVRRSMRPAPTQNLRDSGRQSLLWHWIRRSRELLGVGGVSAGERRLDRRHRGRRLPEAGSLSGPSEVASLLAAERGRRPPIVGRRWSPGPMMWRFYLIQHDRRRQVSRRLERLGRGLEAKDARVRKRATGALAAVGPPALEVLARRLASERTEVAEAAIQSLGRIDSPRARRMLRAHLGPFYRQARLNHEALLALQQLSEEGEVPASAASDLKTWLTDSNGSILRRVLVVKSALGNRRDIKLLQWLAREAEPRVRSNAVEALTSLPTRDFIRPLLPLLEADPQGSIHGKARSQQGGRDPSAVLRRLGAEDSWVAMLTRRLMGEEGSGDMKAGNIDTRDDEAMLDRILFLKSVPLFRVISIQDVTRLAPLAKPVTRAAGEIILHAEDAVTHILVVQDGIVELCVDDVVVEHLRRGASFGEAAILGHPHSATSARAATAVRLLSLPVSAIGDLIVETPEALAPVAADFARRIAALQSTLAGRRCQPLSPSAAEVPDRASVATTC